MSEIRYCKSADGARIAFTTIGTGDALVFVLPNPTSIEIDSELPEARAFYDGLQPGRMLVRYDMRGTGASERDVENVSAQAQLQDLIAVADELHLQEFDIFGGPWIGAHVPIQYACLHPERVRHLVLWAPAPNLRPPSGPGADAERTLIRENWRGATRVMADTIAPRGSIEVRKHITRVCRETLTPEAFLLHHASKSDLSGELACVSTPTLVVTTRECHQFPLAESREVAAGIAGARLVVLEGDSAYFYPYHGQLVPAIRTFLGDAVPEVASFVTERDLRTVLFTDLVGHTQMMSRLGDDAGRGVLREHERITREVLAAHGGTEVKTMGDGFMASFGSVTKAVECAVTLQRAMEEWNTTERAQQAAPLRVRVGLNAGEPIEEDGDLFGATVILASRIAAKAEGGEILVSDNVRSLSAGKGILFADRGEFVAKGLEEPVRVYEVRWREEGSRRPAGTED
jgi:class 3 adenylate cyclase